MFAKELLLLSIKAKEKEGCHRMYDVAIELATENRTSSNRYFVEVIYLEDKNLGLVNDDGFYFRMSSSSPKPA